MGFFNPIEGAIAVNALGDTAVQLPWLAPTVGPLVGMTRPCRAKAWHSVSRDPSAALLLFRSCPQNRPPTALEFTRAAPAGIEFAFRQLSEPPIGVLDSRHPAVRAVLQNCRRYAMTARALAERSGRVDPDLASASALVAPLGWLAISATHPESVANCLADDLHARQPDVAQRKHWGATHAQLARRLARRWELPDWLTLIVGYLDASSEIATTFGGHMPLLAVVQAAVVVAERQNEDTLRLSVGVSLEDSLAVLGLGSNAWQCAEKLAEWSAPDASDGENPYESPLLRQLLELAVENSARREVQLVPRLEAEIDQLHRMMHDQRNSEGERLRRQKLTALAEFAAGAGHEINNPLAVISGQAQYLLAQEADADRQKSLRAVVHQAHRIHQILTDLMQFARPSQPKKQYVDVRDLSAEAVSSLTELALQRQVRIEVMSPDEPCVTDGDPKQLQTVLECLLRNAIEAAPTDGWARIRVEIESSDRLRIAVEDSGPGLIASQMEHLFDPFFSGRPAGRGRGLGLPTAWRLAREHGGSVSFEHQSDGPTRFVVTLPRVPVLPLPQGPGRMSA